MKRHLTFELNFFQGCGHPPFGGIVGTAAVVFAGVELLRLQMDAYSSPQLESCQNPAGQVSILN